ncbi:bifunctional metallophosphatase/5'-nucleotidase [Schleiferilactobacillus harbinensis]|uniref:bifunctional metallophosphatase/5'-nucleotidase n=1 Tax=Schleiferilactobacillus harbinensis TaxID=304207 RepID=UPI0021A6EB54|nr:bifunctional UDP-sugar hydrolase/5'-nucleotidase [Schleiferilactobacillus harbinensis]MCT2909190.1 bifunctional metallophosphatase/5'-nucleotidase [Schleiferilactobacillus harbinensis]
MQETIHLLHTNDLHSHFENWPRITRQLAARKAHWRLAAGTHTVLTFDIGDAMDRAHPLTEATNGQANVAMLNKVGYDAATIGNNEGIGNSPHVLRHLYDQANFPVVLGNLFSDRTTQKLAPFAVDHVLLHSAGGTRILVLGYTAPFLTTYHANGWYPELIGEVLPRQLRAFAGQYDVCILLSHLGIEMDRYIAAHYPQVDVILGAHTHHLLPQGEMDNGVLLGAAGKWGEHVGEMELKLADHHVTSKRAWVYDTVDLPAEPADAAQIKAWADEGHHLLQQHQIARLPQDFPIDYNHPSPMLDLALKALAEYTGTEATILNAGLFLTGLHQGIVTADDLHTQMPHPMHAMKVTLKGTDLWRLVREMEKNRGFLRRFPLKGMSFRGKIFGTIGYRGLSFDAASRTVYWQDRPIDPDREYTVGTLDHYLFVPFFPTIEIMGDNQIMFPDFLRQIVARYLTKHYPIESEGE